ncbi:MAG: ABC transporter ATP-binding protein [Holophaga sp.]|nr:ABC transporter ATP-binding protein [Holophaga sp.]
MTTPAASPTPDGEVLLALESVSTSFFTADGAVPAMSGVSVAIRPGEILGLLGESGCGKTVTALSILGLLPATGRIVAGRIQFQGRDLARLDRNALCALRGDQIAMIFQEPMTALNPVYTVGRQVREAILLHRPVGRAEARRQTLEMFRLVGIPEPEARYRCYPHQLSGGLRQRVMIAMALVCEPSLLIADEPTTALDVTIQAQILDLLTHVKERLDTSIILITHNLGVVAAMCNRVIVLYGGTIVEEGTTREIFYRAAHPYTWGLLRSIPDSSGAEHRRLVPIPGSPPDLIAPPPGCPFTPRCPHAMKVCAMHRPEPVRLTDTHSVSCWLTHELAPVTERP